MRQIIEEGIQIEIEDDDGITTNEMRSTEPLY
jgi:hypothetical protein